MSGMPSRVAATEAPLMNVDREAGVGDQLGRQRVVAARHDLDLNVAVRRGQSSVDCWPYQASALFPSGVMEPGMKQLKPLPA